MNDKKFTFYKEHPKTCDPDDFWGQVKRTVNGEPVSQDQIDMIVDAVVAELKLDSNDSLLDLCCGNGALSALFFGHCKGGLGVDFSEYLISIAKQNFADPPARDFVLQDVMEFCERPISSEIFTKAVCYGSFSYLKQDKAEGVLLLLKKHFPNLRRVFIGNCPDKSLFAEFLGDRPHTHGIESEPDSAIGVWRTQKEFISMAKRCGWQSHIHTMPCKYYASHYRYDIVLSHE